jgi:hypothetical protein
LGRELARPNLLSYQSTENVMQTHPREENETARMNLLQFAYHSGREYVEHGERKADLEAFTSRFGADSRVMRRFNDGANDRRRRAGEGRCKP